LSAADNTPPIMIKQNKTEINLAKLFVNFII